MDSVEPTTDEEAETAVDRRRLLAVIGGGLAAGIAGCSGATSQEFAATPVRLPAAVGEELGLTELFTDSRTTTRELTVGGQDVGVTITNEFAGYGRSYSGPVVWSPSRPTLVERFAGIRSEATPGSGSAINAVASDLDIGQSNPSYVEGDTPVSGDRITLVIPERARHDGEVRLDEMMALHHGDALPVDEVTSRGGNNYLVDLPQVLPDRGFSPRSSGYEPDERWVAGHEGHWLPDDPSSLRCLVCLGEQSPESVFGIDAVCPECRIEDGETVSTEDTIFFSPAPKENPEPDPGVMDAADVFDAGYPTPMGGPTYGLGVIATPNAEIADESVNPLARMGGRELLTSDQTEGVLADAGLTDADEVEWLRGPQQIPGQEWQGTDTATVLGEEVSLELFGGVVSGKEGPWAAAVHVAKTTGDDVVVPGAVHRRPVGTVDGRALFGDGGGFVDRQWTTRALELTREVFASLEAVPEEA